MWDLNVEKSVDELPAELKSETPRRDASLFLADTEVQKFEFVKDIMPSTRSDYFG